MINPSTSSSCSRLRTSTGSAPRRRSIAACSRKSPWTARIPILIGLPAAGFEELFRGERSRGEAGHRVAEAPRDLREDLGVVVVRRRLDDRLGDRRWVGGLEDAGADEDAVGAELHAERGV